MAQVLNKSDNLVLLLQTLRCQALFRGIALFVAMISYIGHSMAELEVKQVANIPTLAVNQVVPDDYEFNLPKNANILIEQTPTGMPFRMHGPYKGTLEAYIKKCESWLSIIRSFCKDGSPLKPGVARGQR
ncbi:MAG: hypothetical protein AAFR90_13450 [Pseudomonadota bacterium]